MNEKNDKKDEGDRDCVICLCSIEGKDMMRATYCRHLFHSQCLVKWFEKNRVNIVNNTELSVLQRGVHQEINNRKIPIFTEICQ